MAPQLLLFRLPRPSEPGEPYCCAVCGKHDSTGAYGPPGWVEVPLSDGDTYTMDRTKAWYCRPHSLDVWAPVLDPKHQAAVRARLRRLEVFAAVRAEGHRGNDAWRIAEARLKEQQ